jgi:aspartate/methionine/tyrosine aminotransferase
VYSFSKSYGMAGWRLGYLVYPRGLKTALRSLQDTIPTHAAMVSQAVGLAALGAGREVRVVTGRAEKQGACLCDAGCPPRACPSGPSLTPLSTTRTAMQWVQRQVAGLTDCRERLWAVLSKHCPGSVRTEGAFYFLAQLPPHVSEAEAVHRLATEYRVLCTPGEAFGAPGTLRLSYGSLPPAECIDALGRLDAGLAALIKEGTDKVSKKKSSILV